MHGHSQDYTEEYKIKFKKIHRHQWAQAVHKATPPWCQIWSNTSVPSIKDVSGPLPCNQTATVNTHKKCAHTHTHKLNNNQQWRGQHSIFRDSLRSQSASDGAYTSAFASRANGWRALQWQERQRVAETETSKYQRGSLTELKTQCYNRLREKHGHGNMSLYHIKPALPNR